MFSQVRIVRHDNSSMTCCGNGIGDVVAVKNFRDYFNNDAPNPVSGACILPTGGPMIQLMTHAGPLDEARSEAEKFKAFGKPIMAMSKVRCPIL